MARLLLWRACCCALSRSAQAVGDALGDLLLVVALLVPLMREQRTDDAIAAWNALYADLFSRQGKVKGERRRRRRRRERPTRDRAVKDRALIKTTDDEMRAVAPAGLQEAIDAAVVSVFDADADARR